jgi:hypothetical protein
MRNADLARRLRGDGFWRKPPDDHARDGTYRRRFEALVFIVNQVDTPHIIMEKILIRKL